MARLAVGAVSAVALGACSIGAGARARDYAISHLMFQREGTVECLERFLAAYPGDPGFVDYLETVEGSRCPDVRILNKDDAQLEMWTEQPVGGWREFKPGEPRSWFTAATQEGDTVEIAVTSVGGGDGGNVENFPVRRTVAACWTLVADLSTRTAEAVDGGECHEAVMWPDTEIMDWEDVRRKYAENVEQSD
ncbi:hypothetical protein AA0Y32_14970 [Georgenia phoenicis]|uniref:hypothetical protein n=1 Tax=unclassified Georgenia TaxID=2626815 RepID=UPI0039B07028